MDCFCYKMRMLFYYKVGTSYKMGHYKMGRLLQNGSFITKRALTNGP